MLSNPGTIDVDETLPPAPSTAARLLLVEDEALFARAVTRRLGSAGYACQHATTLLQAREALGGFAPDVVLLDLRLPDGHGLDLLAELNGDNRAAPVVVLTAYGEVEDAVRAMKLGAADYLKKPVDLEELQLVVERVLRTAGLRQKVDYSRSRESHHSQVSENALLLGDSPAMRAAREQVVALAGLTGSSLAPPPTVLIVGETGTGKDVAARLLHRAGPLQDRPFVQIDCASLPRELIEAELFGHEKGAYTGAQGARAGLLEAAEGGTAFLDEIGELPLDMQAKLLNVIERRVVRRVGSVRERPIAARFVAGTNRDLPAMIAAGQFRADLYYRLNVVTLTMPPLRERGNDVTLLARHFAAQTARRYALDEPGFDPVALSALQRYHWPGNVRELKHLIERAVLLCQGRDIGAADLGLPSATIASTDAAAVPFASMTLDEAERWLIERTLDRVRGNVSEAARRLGVSRMTLRYRIEKHGLRGAVED
ncbi:MAG: sigma-54 dependent transcriptional regulator [Methyloversatilis sp.]|uniref:sigma-54-dependent transcriptional regulator n=1 Tax=Methyloversatilis TaxID=378210 RepID=UPI0025D02C42|nr:MULTISPECIES: sigma-54 dependent transcriptional regulator [Methyloversatilis]MBV5284561.1 sigma-54-dependent Fis family transcriptional regulator [Methyloversatilis discipulorum]MCR6666832.1 sigma-54 dependent transcriptional regulator [Methyloversatilis sp.]